MARNNSKVKHNPPLVENPAVAANLNLEAEYRERQELFEAQPAICLRFIEAQAASLAEAIANNQSQARFMLPDRVCVAASSQPGAAAAVIPASQRDQLVGGVFDRLAGTSLRTLIRNHLMELENSENPAVATSALLIRHAIAVHLVYRMLPSGRSVRYTTEEGEEIPTLPARIQAKHTSAITEATDAIAEDNRADAEHGELQVPFVPAALGFYMPQWVAFDEDRHLLVNSVNEAETYLASMQRFIAMLHMAVSLCPYFVFDPQYKQKRYGMLGQLVNQGRAMARYEVDEMVRTIKKRAAAHTLNRGLSLSIPYFDDQSLELRLHDFMVIPAGRILFSPAFVVQAAREEQLKVAQDTRLSPSTRKYLLVGLHEIELAFIKPEKHS